MSGGAGGRKLGLFGGSFDPIHYGHILPVRAAKEALGLERVLYLPTARPPHKGARFATPLQRWAMVELALLDQDGLDASPLELTPEPAYTIETLEHFSRAEPGAQLHLLIGGDSFADLPHWRRWHELFALARVVVLVRPGWENEGLLAAAPAELAAAVASGRVTFIANPPVAVSSTELRETFAAGRVPAAGLVPDAVVKYVRKYGLYR